MARLVGPIYEHQARENIERALAEYPGAIIYATHDEVLAQALGADKQVALSMSG